MHVEFHRIYKSLDFEDFLEETSFIMAKGGMDCLPYIQDANCLKKTTPEKALKQFVKSILMAGHTYCPNISVKDEADITLSQSRKNKEK